MTQPIEEWVKQRWGGFTYLTLRQSEDFILTLEDGNLLLHYETEDRNSQVGRLLLMEAATKEFVIKAEELFAGKPCVPSPIGKIRNW